MFSSLLGVYPHTCFFLYGRRIQSYSFSNKVFSTGLYNGSRDGHYLPSDVLSWPFASWRWLLSHQRHPFKPRYPLYHLARNRLGKRRTNSKRNYRCISSVLVWLYRRNAYIDKQHSSFFVLANHSFLPNWGTLADGGLPYIVVGIVLYIFKDNRKLQCITYIIASLSMQVLFRGWLWSANDPAFTWSKLVTDLSYCQWLSVFTVVFFLLYNGKKGRGCKQLFYWFYPIHVYVLYFLSCVCQTLHP